jgi:hypothetical protein
MSLYNNMGSSYNRYNNFLLHATMSYLAAKANSGFHLLSSLVFVGVPDTHVWLYITYTVGSPFNILTQSQLYQVEIALGFS